MYERALVSWGDVTLWLSADIGVVAKRDGMRNHGIGMSIRLPIPAQLALIIGQAGQVGTSRPSTASMLSSPFYSLRMPSRSFPRAAEKHGMDDMDGDRARGVTRG